MPTILVVDDSALDRYLAGTLLEEQPGWKAVYAEDGREALVILKKMVPDLVLTDLQMPEVNGLALVEAIHRDFPFVPVILMTAHGSEEIAVTALQKGAASYVPKRNLASDLSTTVANVLKVTQSTRNNQQVLDCLAETQFHFVLTNDFERIQSLIGYLQDQLIQMDLVDKSGLIRVGTALYEVLLNAIEHGNLEVSSELRESSNLNAYKGLVEQRRRQPPYRDRLVRLTAQFSRREAVYIIRDEGPGFDPSRLPSPTDPTNLEKSSGRGLLLIRTFMDEVRFNATGNEITLFKRGR